MNKQRVMVTAMILGASLTFGCAGASAADIKKDHLAFAVCDDYVNIRAKADTESGVVAKLYNHSAVTVLEIYDDGWCLVSSGNAVGYMKESRLVAGEDAYAIEKEVAYNVAIPYTSGLDVHAKANDESNVIDEVEANQQLEVVEYNGGAWIKVAVAADSIGYVDASQCAYKTYYPVAVLEDEELAKQVAASYVPATTEKAAAVSEEKTLVVEEPENYEETSNQEVVVDSDSEATNEEYYEDTAENNYDYAGEAVDDTEETVQNTDTEYAEDTSAEETTTEEAVEITDTTDEYQDGSDATTYDVPYDEGTEESDAEDASYDDVYIEEDSSSSESTDSTSTTTTSATSSSDGSLGQQIADYALQYVGNSYVYGGTSLTNGTDCSGFTQSVMSEFGIDISRTAETQSSGGTSVSTDDLQAGDLLFYSDGSGISHVAMYIGDGQIVHAANEDQGIIVSNYDYDTPVSASRYW